MVMVRSYLAMLPRLSAEETLDAATAAALGGGTLKDASKVHRALQLAIDGPTPPRAQPLNRAAMASMGLGVVTPDG